MIREGSTGLGKVQGTFSSHLLTLGRVYFLPLYMLNVAYSRRLLAACLISIFPRARNHSPSLASYAAKWPAKKKGSKNPRSKSFSSA